MRDLKETLDMLEQFKIKNMHTIDQHDKEMTDTFIEAIQRAIEAEKKVAELEAKLDNKNNNIYAIQDKATAKLTGDNW